MIKDYAKFLVSFKLILKKGDKMLLLTESDAGCLDLPGGRLEKGEDTLSIEKALERELREELGKDVKYEIWGPVFQYRRHPHRKTYVLLTAYKGKYISGKIKLSPEHNKYEWVNPKKQNLKNRKFNNPEEKLAFLNYFKKWK